MNQYWSRVTALLLLTCKWRGVNIMNMYDVVVMVLCQWRRQRLLLRRQKTRVRKCVLAQYEIRTEYMKYECQGLAMRGGARISATPIKCCRMASQNVDAASRRRRHWVSVRINCICMNRLVLRVRYRFTLQSSRVFSCWCWVKTCCDHGGENTLYILTGVYCREVRLVPSVRRPML